MIHYTISKPSQNYPSTHTGVLVESSSQSLSRSVGLLDAQMPKFHLLHHDTTCSVCRVASWRAVMRVAPCLLQHGRLWKSSSAHVYKFSILCSGFASISGTTSGKSEVDMSTPVHAVRMPLNTCRASHACRVCRNECVVPCCLTSETQHVTTFSCVKMHGLDSMLCRVVLWRYSSSGIWAKLIAEH